MPIAIDDDSELQERLRIVQNAFDERARVKRLLDNYVNGEKGLDPFVIDFHGTNYGENRERRSVGTRLLSFATVLHRKFGLFHILLIVLMALYTLLGGLMFKALEARSEREIVAKTMQGMTVAINDFVDLIVNISITETNETIRHDMLSVEAKRFYKHMLISEGRFLGSVWHKAENLEMNIQWTTLPAMFYAFTLFTTIGYGSISCYSWPGRYISIVYACIGIPLMLLTIGDLGELLQRKLCELNAWLEKRWRSLRNKKVIEYDEDERMLPLWFAVVLLSVYFSFVSVGIYLGDKMGPQPTDFPLSASFYFVFISITTTGFGDVMPNSAQYNPLTYVAFLCGFVLVSVVNSTIYSRLYNYFYKGISSVKDNAKVNCNESSEHTLFKELYPAFVTLALSFPSTERPELQPSSSCETIVMNSEYIANAISNTPQGRRLMEPVEERSYSENISSTTGRHRTLSEEEQPRRLLSIRSMLGTFGVFDYQSRPPSTSNVAIHHRRRVDSAIAPRRKRIWSHLSRSSDCLYTPH